MNSFWISLTIDFLLGIFILDCLFLGLVILMQRSKQRGSRRSFWRRRHRCDLGARKPRRFWSRPRSTAAALFFILTITLARLNSMRESEGPQASSVQQELEKSIVPVPSTTNVAPITTAAPAPVAPTAAPAANSVANPTTPAKTP